MTVQSNTLHAIANAGKKLSLWTMGGLLLLAPAKELSAAKKRPNSKTAQKTVVFDTIRTNLNAIQFSNDTTKLVRFKHINEPEALKGLLVKGMDYKGVFYRAYPETMRRGPDGIYYFSTQAIWDKYIALATRASLLSRTENPSTALLIDVQTNGRFSTVTLLNGKNSVAAFVYDEIQNRFLILDDRQIAQIDLLGEINSRGGFSIQIQTKEPLTSTNVWGRNMNRADIVLDFDKDGNNCRPRNDIDRTMSEVDILLNDLVVERVVQKKRSLPMGDLSPKSARQR